VGKSFLEGEDLGSEKKRRDNLQKKPPNDSRKSILWCSGHIKMPSF
jgi:hypothetical protein